MKKPLQQFGQFQHRCRPALALLVFCSTLWSCAEPQVFEEVASGAGVTTTGAQAISCPQYPHPFALDLPRDPKALEIHVDASGSMGGYTRNPRSQYNRTLELLEQITTSYQEVSPSYFRAGFDQSSGQESQQISRSQFRRARKIEFYDGITEPETFPGVTSNLKSAILPDPGDRPEGFEANQRLLVLITDLSPDDGDMIGLTESFKRILAGSSLEATADDQRHNSQTSHMAVALIGMRSEFQGYLQSPNEKRYPFPSKDYSTDGLKPEQYRPFYLIAAGHVQYVQEFLSKLTMQVDAIGSDMSKLGNVTIFYPSLLAPLRMGDVANVQLQKNLGFADWDQYTLNDDNVFVEFLDPSAYQTFRIPSDENEPLEFSYSLSFESAVEISADLSAQWIIPQTLGVVQHTEVYNSNTQSFTRTDNLFELEINLLEILEGQSATLSVSLDPKAMNSSSIYINHLYVEAIQYQEQEWWDTWDFDQGLQGRSSLTDTSSETYILSTTPGLKQFSQGLADFTVGMMRSGALCHAFQRNN